MQIDLASGGAEVSTLSQTLRSQVCVVGGGIAGLLLAHRLAEAGVEVTLLESGGRATAGGHPADPFGAELQGHPHVGTREGRVCALGGCSSTWGGQLLPLPGDAMWPVGGAELQGYELAAERLFGVDERPYDGDRFFAQSGLSKPALLARERSFVPRLSKFVPFGRRNLAATIGRELAAHPRVKVVLNAPVVELLPSAGLERIGAAAVGLRGDRRGDRRVVVQADQFVVAAGTVETCRLLLASRSVAAEGIGNTERQVGANFHDHLTLTAARLGGPGREIALRELGAWVFGSVDGATVHSLKLEMPRELRERLGINAAMVHVTVEEPASSGVAVLRDILRARQRGSITAELWRRSAELPTAVADAVRLGWSARVLHRRFVSRNATVRLQLNLAQDARSNSRVGLAETRDRLGMPAAVVDWRVSGAELQSLRSVAGYVRERLLSSGVERGAEWEPALFSEAGEYQLLSLVDDARHSMGGACMGTDPRSSVVDTELRVHGMENLSVASAAVFPDGSPQLPTLTLAALSLRLADRLTKQLA